eukprot:7505407-Alexandrium_andersonii.AAC.1
MSASLVGSEMCIRDRLGAAGSARSAVDPYWAEPVVQCLTPKIGPEYLCNCLLYTSDAADDM